MRKLCNGVLALYNHVGGLELDEISHLSHQILQEVSAARTGGGSGLGLMMSSMCTNSRYRHEKATRGHRKFYAPDRPGTACQLGKETKTN